MVRNALGDAARTLDRHICDALQDELRDRQVHIDNNQAWWAVDYHFNWLYAALQVHCRLLKAGARAWDNTSKAVQGNQEDVDLIVVSGDDVILVEAKYERWRGKELDQLASKVARLKLLNADEDGRVGRSPNQVRLHFVLMSPDEPDGDGMKRLIRDAPMWVRRQGEETWRWTKLLVDDPKPDLRVHRSDERGKKATGGFHWTIKGPL